MKNIKWLGFYCILVIGLGCSRSEKPIVSSANIVVDSIVTGEVDSIQTRVHAKTEKSEKPIVSSVNIVDDSVVTDEIDSIQTRVQAKTEKTVEASYEINGFLDPSPSPKGKFLKFRNEKGVILKTFDVDLNNPFVIEDSSIRVRNFFMDTEYYSYDFESEWEPDEKIVEHHLWTSTIDVGEYNTHVQVNYTKSEVSNKGKIRKYVSRFLVFNKIGDIIWDKEWEYETGFLAVTDDEKYAIQVISPDIDGENEWFEIWDIKRDSIIHKQIIVEKGERLGMAISYPHQYLKVDATFPNNNSNISSVFYYFNPKDMTLLRLVYTKEDHSNYLKLFRKTRVLFGDDSILANLDRFEHQFIPINYEE